MIELKWQSGLAFEAKTDDGVTFTFDALKESGGSGKSPSPLEGLLGALAACAAMDVISILEKKRQAVTGYRVEIEGDRPPAGEWPRPYTAIRMRHIVTGENIDPDAVGRAIQLSEEKYCSALATLRQNPSLSSSYEITAKVPS